jgi:hypothetical protein
MKRIQVLSLAVVLWAGSALVLDSAASAEPVAATRSGAACASTVGPGIPPPSSVRSGISGFHAAWYGQSGYPTLCPGEHSTATVAYYNSGSFGWVRGRMGEMAFLGTSGPIPGHDQASLLGGDGQFGSPATGWPRYNRVAPQPADYVGPGQVAWFQFTIQAPTTPGNYVLFIRPVIEGATWMEDFGVYWLVSVKDAGAGELIDVAPSSEGDAEVGTTREYTGTVNGAPNCVDLAFVDAPGLNFEGRLTSDSTGAAVLSSAATFVTVNGTNASGSYVDCAALSANQVRFHVTSTIANSYVHPIVFQDLNGNNKLDGAEPWGIGGEVRFVPSEAAAGSRSVIAGAVSAARDYFTDSGATATYRYDSNDTFQRAGAAISFAQFDQLISRGDTLSVSYEADSAQASTFNITNDLGREAPSVDALVDSWDRGPTQNDIGVRFTEPATQVDDVGYTIQRAKTGPGTTCDASSGAYAELTRTVIGRGRDSELYLDRDLAVGAYCYRVGAIDPTTSAIAFGYSQRVVISNPPTPVAPPRSLDARVTTSGGSPAVLDPGDVIKIAFDKAMQNPGGSQMRVQDADGTTAEIRCLFSDQVCTFNAGPETLGGVVYPANTVLTITMRTGARIVSAGTAAGLQLNVTITGGGFVDLAGNGWDVNGSDDVTLGAPD